MRRRGGPSYPVTTSLSFHIELFYKRDSFVYPSNIVVFVGNEGELSARGLGFPSRNPRHCSLVANYPYFP